jgi:hypothetical protein
MRGRGHKALGNISVRGHGRKAKGNIVQWLFGSKELASKQQSTGFKPTK